MGAPPETREPARSNPGSPVASGGEVTRSSGQNHESWSLWGLARGLCAGSGLRQGALILASGPGGNRDIVWSGSQGRQCVGTLCFHESRPET